MFSASGPSGGYEMNILQVVPSYYPAAVYGGPIFSIHYTAAALAEAGVDVAVATTNANGATKLNVPTDRDVVFAPRYRVRYYDDTIIGRFSWAFTRHVGHDIARADVVHLQDVFSTHAAWTLMQAARYKKPVLISPRGVFTSWSLANRRAWLKRFWIAAFTRPFVGDTRRVRWHATSEEERKDILRLFPGAFVYVVPNGLDCGAFDAVAVPSRKDWFARFFPNAGVVPQEATIFVGLGRLHVKKAFDIAIRTLHLLDEQYPKAILAIAGGDDGERGRLETLAQELCLADRVCLVGTLDGNDKIAFLKGADLLLFPSHSENFGMVALEALAAGLPVIASRNTPWREIEVAGAGAWVKNTPEDFAAAVQRLLDGNRVEMREMAQSLARRYDISVIASRFKEIYEEMANGSGE